MGLPHPPFYGIVQKVKSFYFLPPLLPEQSPSYRSKIQYWFVFDLPQILKFSTTTTNGQPYSYSFLNSTSWYIYFIFWNKKVKYQNWKNSKVFAVKLICVSMRAHWHILMYFLSSSIESKYCLKVFIRGKCKGKKSKTLSTGKRVAERYSINEPNITLAWVIEKIPNKLTHPHIQNTSTRDQCANMHQFLYGKVATTHSLYAT